MEADMEVVAHPSCHTPVAARQTVAVLQAEVAMVVAAVVVEMGDTEVAMAVAVAPTHWQAGAG